MTKNLKMPVETALRAATHEEGDLSDLLSELRILLPGAQMLTAFLIILPFNSGARDFIVGERFTFLATFFFSLSSLILLSAPAIQHRLMRPLISRERFKRLATREVVLGAFALALALTLGTNLVIASVFGSLAGHLASAGITVLFLFLWCVLPMYLKQRHGY